MADTGTVQGGGDVSGDGEGWFVVCGWAVGVGTGEGHVDGVAAADADGFAFGEDLASPCAVGGGLVWLAHDVTANGSLLWLLLRVWVTVVSPLPLVAGVTVVSPLPLTVVSPLPAIQ